jgi:hypothetical protein
MQFLCIKEKEDFVIGGGYKSDIYKYIQTTVDPCDNSTSGIVCAP